uniref:Putative secreted protein n=1 Tax=Anopheles darlingi TaxID=43151 RepID=A0A2M4DK67_ANODA
MLLVFSSRSFSLSLSGVSGVGSVALSLDTPPGCARCASERGSTNQSEHTSAREHSKIQKIMELCGTKAEPPFSINRCNPST